MADFEDAHSPTWEATIQGQINLRDAVRGTIELRQSRGQEVPAEQARRPRSWSGRAAGTWPRSMCTVDGQPVSASLFDFALYLFHNAKALLDEGDRARISTCPSWRTISRPGSGTTSSSLAQEELGLPRGTIQATVLIETILAAFEMDEILYELRDHSSGSTAAAGTTSSASSRSSATGPSSCCPTGRW